MTREAGDSSPVNVVTLYYKKFEVFCQKQKQHLRYGVYRPSRVYRVDARVRQPAGTSPIPDGHQPNEQKGTWTSSWRSGIFWQTPPWSARHRVTRNVAVDRSDAAAMVTDVQTDSIDASSIGSKQPERACSSLTSMPHACSSPEKIMIAIPTRTTPSRASAPGLNGKRHRSRQCPRK